ncbi:MAG: type transport system ATP-binding protein [Herbinix sp.]|jgi:ABC-2 type transport system ATP-binding protein|nr:type transport system ATP-binding protein [Herbinix sp.]
MNSIVTAENLTKRFGKKLVLDRVSFDILPGRIVGLMGENGTGKTTILKILADQYKADEGMVRINGIPVSSQTHKHVSYMLNEINVYPWMRIRSLINYYTDMFSDFQSEKAYTICDQLELHPKDYFWELSKGNMERVLLMLSISRKASLYLLDEPISGLDPRMKNSIIKMIVSNMEDNASMIIASHMLRDLEEIFDDLLILHQHHMIKASSEDIREQYGKSVEEYFLEVTNHA